MLCVGLLYQFRVLRVRHARGMLLCTLNTLHLLPPAATSQGSRLRSQFNNTPSHLRHQREPPCRAPHTWPGGHGAAFDLLRPHRLSASHHNRGPTACKQQGRALFTLLQHTQLRVHKHTQPPRGMAPNHKHNTRPSCHRQHCIACWPTSSPHRATREQRDAAGASPRAPLVATTHTRTYVAQLVSSHSCTPPLAKRVQRHTSA